MFQSKRFLAALLLTSAALTTPAAASLVLDLGTGGTAIPCTGGCGAGTTVGWSFRVINPITIDQIGVWDAGADGLDIASVAAGLWRADGTLLASATITDASEQVASASTDGLWLFEGIATLVLAPGSYVIGSVFTNDFPVGQVNPPYTAIADIEVSGGARSSSAGGLSFPDTSFPALVFGPTMRLAPAAVPEPAGLALAALGLLIASGVRRGAQRSAR